MKLRIYSPEELQKIFTNKVKSRPKSSNNQEDIVFPKDERGEQIFFRNSRILPKKKL